MLKIEWTTQFKKDVKLVKKRGLDITLLEEVVDSLSKEELLPEKYKDHQLEVSKYYKGYRECHIKPDWLLIYKIIPKECTLRFMRTGSHSDLFK